MPIDIFVDIPVIHVDIHVETLIDILVDTLEVIPVDIQVDIRVDTLVGRYTQVDMYPHLVPGSVLLPWLLVRQVTRMASTDSSRVRIMTRAGTH